MTATGLFNRLRATSFAMVLRIALIAWVVMVGAFQLCGFIGLRINASPSLPIGLYLTSNESRANLVEFCPSAAFGSVAIARGYRDHGTCQDGGAPLLKPVVARAGDVVEVSAQGIAVNGRLLPNTVPFETDTQGRSLTAWQSGRYIVAPDRIWVASSYNKRSFDSRYFGPVASSAIRNHVRPLVTLP